MLRLQPGNDRYFDPHANFRNAVASGNATTQYIRALFDVMHVPSPYQLQFYTNADLVIDNRNLQAHYYRGAGLPKAVDEAQALFSRHTELVCDPLLNFCKQILDAYPSFHNDAVLCRVFSH